MADKVLNIQAPSSVSDLDDLAKQIDAAHVEVGVALLNVSGESPPWFRVVTPNPIKHAPDGFRQRRRASCPQACGAPDRGRESRRHLAPLRNQP